MNISGVDGILWAAGFLGHLILFGILIFNGQARSYPTFTVFVGFGAVRTIALFLVWRISRLALYTDLYWAFAAMDTCLQVALIGEMIRVAFKRGGAWKANVRWQLILLCAASMCAAVSLTRLQVTRGFGPFQTVVLKSNYCAAVLMSALFAGVIVLSSKEFIHWTGHVTSIVIGLAAYSFIAILIEAVDNLFGFGGHGTVFATLQTARKVLYLVCLIYWSYSLSRVEPPQRTMSPRMEGQLSALREAVIRKSAGWDE